MLEGCQELGRRRRHSSRPRSARLFTSSANGRRRHVNKHRKLWIERTQLADQLYARLRPNPTILHSHRVRHHCVKWRLCLPKGHHSETLRREVSRVVLHEIAHHFGISDERLVELDRY
jgi:hypothetical protein